MRRVYYALKTNENTNISNDNLVNLFNCHCSGCKKILQIWCWLGNCSQPYLQLRIDITKSVENIRNLFKAIKLEFGAVFSRLRGHLQS